MNEGRSEILNYWNKDDVESMYDKNLMKLEVELIKKNIKPGSKILDAGCGEGESTKIYSGIPNTTIYAVDFSETRLKKAKQNLRGINNIIFKNIDFLKNYKIDSDFDCIISQRFLINILDWKQQKKVIKKLVNNLKSGGTLILLEGSKNGTDELNKLRGFFGLSDIPVKWHNLFFDDNKLEKYLKLLNCEIIRKDGMGEYFIFTRGIRPFFEKNTNWDCDFNKISSDIKTKNCLNFDDKFSRLKLWIINKN